MHLDTEVVLKPEAYMALSEEAADDVQLHSHYKPLCSIQMWCSER